MCLGGSGMAAYLKTLAAAAALIGCLPFAPTAFAHHVMGGELPRTAAHGLLSGLGHPIIGIDHFAFIVGVGLMSHLAGRIVLLPGLFVAATIFGCFMHVEGAALPWSEPLIALSVAVIAALVGMRVRTPAGVLASLFV